MAIYRHVQKVIGHNGGVVYADDGRVIKWTGENIIHVNELLKLKKSYYLQFNTL